MLAYSRWVWPRSREISLGFRVDTKWGILIGNYLCCQSVRRDVIHCHLFGLPCDLNAAPSIEFLDHIHKGLHGYAGDTVSDFFASPNAREVS